jgi:hypothetical protein
MTTPFFLPQLIEKGYARAAGLRIASLESHETIKARLSSPADAFDHNAYSDVDNEYDHYKICAGQKPSGKRKEVE